MAREVDVEGRIRMKAAIGRRGEGEKRKEMWKEERGCSKRNIVSEIRNKRKRRMQE